MIVQITIKETFWAIENCWENIQSIDFKYNIRKSVKQKIADIIEANEGISDADLETQLQASVIDIEIDNTTFVQVMKAVNSQAQGIALTINPPLYDKLKTQILTLAISGDVDAIALINEMTEILVQNATMLNNKIASGKERILS